MKALLGPSDELCRRLLDAEALLFATPMYNFSIPSAFKAYIDSIVRAGITYKVSPEGAYVGQLNQTKALFLTTRGADLRPGGPFGAYDALTPSLRSAFGFIGLTAPTFVDAQPLQFAKPAAREEALVRAKAELEAVASDDRRRMGDRIVWLRTGIASSQLPVSRTTHMSSGFVKIETENRNEVKIRSQFIMHEIRADHPVKSLTGLMGHVFIEEERDTHIDRKLICLLDANRGRHNPTFLV